MTSQQLDLFTPDTETRRLVDGLTCIRDAVPGAMHMVIYLSPPERRRAVDIDGDWAYTIRREGMRFENLRDMAAAIEAGDWARSTPAYLLTWPELAAQVEHDPRRARIAEWAGSLTGPDSWLDLYRPHELWPYPELRNPNYIRRDRERAGWPERVTAWRDLIVILTDAIARARHGGSADPKTQRRSAA